MHAAELQCSQEGMVDTLILPNNCNLWFITPIRNTFDVHGAENGRMTTVMYYTVGG